MSSTTRDDASVGIVILNYNGWKDTIDCLVSVLAIRERITIVVVDNASPDGSEQKIRSWAEEELGGINAARAAAGRAPVRFREAAPDEEQATAEEPSAAVDLVLIQSGHNGGYAAGNNIGIRFALAGGCDYVWLLNNDTVVEPDALSWLLARMREDETIGLCGSTLAYFSRPDMVQALGGGHFKRWRGWSSDIGERLPISERLQTPDVESRLSYINGASTLASRAFLETVGLMEEGYFLYWEEIDWAFRGRGRFRLGYARNSIVRHKVGASIGTQHQGPQSALADFYLLRGAVIFCRRYSSISLPGVLFDAFRGVCRLARRGEWSRARHQLRALLGYHYPADRMRPH